MDSQRQHFVPEVYLREFTSERKGFFHQLNISNPRLEIRQVHVQNVCYVTNFYDINSQQELNALKLANPRYLETSFSYENVLLTILNKIRGRQQYLSRNEFEVLIEAYVSIKHRVPKYRKEIAKIQQQGVIFDQIAGNLKNELRPLIEYHDFDYDNYVASLKKQLQEDPNYPKFSHLRGLVESSRTTNELVTDAINKILSMNIAILQASGKDDYFFTSDNPGYSLLGNKMFNTNYGAFNQIVWPINSKQAILLEDFDTLNYIKPLVRLRYIPLTTKFVEQVNTMSLQIADEKLFCENRDFLNQFKLNCNSIRAEQQKLIDRHS